MKKIKIFLAAKTLAIKRRLNILLFGNFDPYPKIYKNYKLYPSMIVEGYNKENNLILIEGPKGHTYYPQLLWPAIMKFFK
jgi:hypothetical protein